MVEARRKLLLVDDDDAVIEYLTVKLAGEFDLVSTSSAAEVLALVRAEHPDLVLCDIDLQGDKDGGDISVDLYSYPETRGIPLVYLTALVSPADLAKSGNQLAGRAAISKQAPVEQIIERIRASLP